MKEPKNRKPALAGADSPSSSIGCRRKENDPEPERRQAQTLLGPATRIASSSLQRIRERFPEYARSLGDLRKLGANRWRMSCPLPEHADNRPSFTLFVSHQGGYLAKCSCGWSGDVVKLVRTLHPSMPFQQAVGHVADIVGVSVERVAGTPEARIARHRTNGERPTPEPPPPDLPPNFEERHRAARARLYGSPRLLKAAAAELGRNVTPELVQSLTYSSDALGWADGRLLYLYEHGAKVRNPEGTEPRFFWKLGKAAFPWRWHFAAREEVREIYLTESESDAVALVAAGLEVLHPRGGKPASAVVAIPGADSFAEGWAPLFRGKRVTLVFDWDGKSDKARDKTARLLARYAARVATLRTSTAL